MKQIYDKIETGTEVRIRKLVQQSVSNSPKQEMFVNNVNLYEKALLSNRNMRKNNLQIKQWLILSDNIKYVKSEDSDIMNGIEINQ